MFELRLMCPQERVEPVCDALEALDALSVSVEDADAQTDAEQAQGGRGGEARRVGAGAAGGTGAARGGLGTRREGRLPRWRGPNVSMSHRCQGERRVART